MLRFVTQPGQAPNPIDDPENVLFEGHPAMVPGLLELSISILTVGLALLYFWSRARATRYRITNQRVIVESGLFSKRLEQIDTYRIHDYVVERPFVQRMLGTGNLLLSTQDSSTPAVRLFGLKTDVVVLYEQLRRATEQQKRLRGVRVLDTDHRD